MHKTLTGSVASDFALIVRRNLSIALQMIVGICTLCIFTVFELAWNGYQHGFDLHLLSTGCPQAFYLFLTYAPLEITSLTLIAASSQSLALHLMKWLIGDSIESSIRTTFVALFAGILLLLVAAMIEANMKPVLQSIPCK
jgi:uncharacterized membrane protein SpoIIM required for sporulation